MKIVLSWLNDLAPIGNDAEALAELMTSLGVQVEAIVVSGGTVDGVVTARVVRTERHPEAAKVHRVWVDAGDGAERHVWCGAFNMAADDVIPLATPGTVMPDGRVIEPRPILGIDSRGMLCSAHELGLGNDRSGILILPAGTPVGVPYGSALNLQQETCFEVDLTRNRPDCWGHLGVARDVAARLGASLAAPPAMPMASTVERSASVDLVDGERCPRFTTLVLSGVEVAESPTWISRRLEAAGMRSINNVVDASNYVMLELNQPNHAYDFDALAGHGLRVRLAADGESIVTLDGVTRQLTSDDLLICDADDTPIGVGGVMGGLHSEITDRTTVVALEMAMFEQTAITRTMNRLGLRSEASGRYERGVDPHGIERAQARFVELLALSCDALVVHEGAVDARHASLMPVQRHVQVRVSQVNRILGTELNAVDIETYIAPIGYELIGESGDELTVGLPSWRPDSNDEIDVIEEVARHYGYDALGMALPKSSTHGRLSPMQQRRRTLRQVVLGLGASEVMTETFLGALDLDDARLGSDSIRVTNPLQVDEDVLRPSMLPGLLRVLAFNASRRRTGLFLFEIGRVYPPGDRSSELPPERELLSMVWAGRDAPAAMQLWREISSATGIGARVDQSLVAPWLHPTRSATLSLGRDAVGSLGEVHPDVLEAFAVAERVAWLEVDLSRLLSVDPKVVQWKATSRYPSTDIDLAFQVPETVSAERVDKAVRQGAAGLLVDLALFDVFRAPGSVTTDSGAAPTRSLAYRLRLQANDRTLADSDVVAVRDKVVSIVSKLGGVLRG